MLTLDAACVELGTASTAITARADPVLGALPSALVMKARISAAPESYPLDAGYHCSMAGNVPSCSHRSDVKYSPYCPPSKPVPTALQPSGTGAKIENGV